MAVAYLPAFGWLQFKKSEEALNSPVRYIKVDPRSL